MEDEGSLSLIVWLVILALVHAFITLIYHAVTTNPSLFLADERDEQRSKRLSWLSDHMSQLHITVAVVVFLVRVAVIAVVTVMVKTPLLALPEGVSEHLIPVFSYAVVLLPFALIFYVGADLIPATIGRARADRLMPFSSLILRLLVGLLKPLIAPLVVLEQSLSRVSGGGHVAKTVTDEEIRSLIDENGGSIESDEKEMIISVLEFGETLAREIMVPRLDLTAIEIESSLDEALAAFVESGHSRIPVYQDSVDNIRGVLYAKDILNLWHKHESGKTITDLMRPAYFVPETKSADTLFREMQARKVHLAMIVDEYGGTSGLVTIEDLLEEIVGDIQDEYDQDEHVMMVRHSDDEYTIDASMNLDDFNSMLDVSLSTDESDTLGGYIFDQIGRVPNVGEAIDVMDSRLNLRVDSVDGRRIRKVRVTRLPEDTGETSPETE